MSLSKYHSWNLSRNISRNIWFWLIYIGRLRWCLFVELDKGCSFLLNVLLRSCNFFPRNQGAMVFPGTTICRVMASFHNFMFFIYFLIDCNFFCLAKKGGIPLINVVPCPLINVVPVVQCWSMALLWFSENVNMRSVHF